MATIEDSWRVIIPPASLRRMAFSLLQAIIHVLHSFDAEHYRKDPSSPESTLNLEPLTLRGARHISGKVRGVRPRSAFPPRVLARVSQAV